MKKSNRSKMANPVTEDDLKQSGAFRQALADLEASGELNEATAEVALNMILRDAVGCPKVNRPS